MHSLRQRLLLYGMRLWAFLTVVWQPRGFILDREAGVPIPRITSNGQGFNFVCDISVLLDSDVADFRQLKFRTQLGPALRVSETVVSIASLESRETSFLPTLHSTKECFAGLVEAPQRILQHLAEYNSNVRSNFLDIGQLIDLVKCSDRRAVLPRLDSLWQASIVQFPTHIERRCQSLSLLAIRV